MDKRVENDISNVCRKIREAEKELFRIAGYMGYYGATKQEERDLRRLAENISFIRFKTEVFWARGSGEIFDNIKNKQDEKAGNQTTESTEKAQ